ncbi:MAG: LysE family translocator [Pseudomonadales bacterium]|nr:LysE family translocator [Pseudomonadales bacterium]
MPIVMFCFSSSITPGPNNIMLMTSGLNFGIRRTIPHLLGINIGFPLMVAAIGLGLGHIFVSYPSTHLAVKIAGAVYLLFLAWKIANSASPKLANEHKRPLTFIQAALFQWLNPKAWVIAVGAIATFTTVENYNSRLLIIIGGYLTIGGLSMLLWLLLGASLQNVISNQRRIQCFNKAMGLVLALSVIPMLLVEFNNGV